MNKPISLAIAETREQIVKAINESGLPPSVVEALMNPIYKQIAQAAQSELAQAKESYKETEEHAESN